MKLRALELQDAYLMVEWMHDATIVKNMHANFLDKTEKDCEEFIRCSREDKNNMHLAIASDDNIYMGTVSLKHIIKNDAAEFGIVVRRQAQGKGYAKWAMEEIIKIGISKLNLKKIYWCVDPENRRAMGFYDKNNYLQIDKLDRDTVDYLMKEKYYTLSQIETYKWYQYSRAKKGNTNRGNTI